MATCFSSVDASFIDNVTWQNSAGDILASTSSSNTLDLVFDPVNDSMALEMEVFICRVAPDGNGAVASRSFQLLLIRKSSCTKSALTFNYTTTHLPSVDPEEPVLAVNASSGTSFYEDPLSLTCMVREVFDGFTGMPDIMWLNLDDDQPVSNISGDVFISIDQTDTSVVSVLTFESLRPLQAMQYRCEGSLESLGITFREESTVMASIDCEYNYTFALIPWQWTNGF